MLLFKKAFHAGLQSGAITLTFRRWQKPHVKPGGRYRCHPIGVLEVDNAAVVPVADITGTSRAIVDTLVDMHVDRVKLPVYADVHDLHFAWAGSAERGRHHYYRLAGPRFLVEYDNTQNDANHAHSVWRDPGNDFGDDLLRRHLAEDHSG